MNRPEPTTYILGVSAYYHDSAACLVQEGRIVAAAQEERFNRKKHSALFPEGAIRYCLKEAGVGIQDLKCVVYYEKPFLKFERLLETYLSFAPRGLPSFWAAMPVWLKEKLFLKRLLRSELSRLGGIETASLPPLLFSEHHESHAASAYYPSPFRRAAVLTLDGVGEWATSSAWTGNDGRLKPLWEIPFPHSLGLLYSAFTYFTGFKVNSGEYKLMGLAPYGEPRFVQKIYENLVDVKGDGSFRLNLDFFDYCTGLRMTNERFNSLFGGPPREPESALTQREMDLAKSIQVVTEEIVLRLGKSLQAETGMEHLCLAGGVALNCVANGRLVREGPFQDLWIQPAAGDAGGALGAALLAWHQWLEQPLLEPRGPDAMQGSYLGPAYRNGQVKDRLRTMGAKFEEFQDQELIDEVAESLASGKIVGWFQGRMEFGPRALGARSILGDPRDPLMQSNMNLKIKYRESFRPFAPSVLSEFRSEYFELEVESPYMLIVAEVADQHKVKPATEEVAGLERLKDRRSTIPAVTHVDYSARVQTVDTTRNERYHALLSAFRAKTGCGVLVNTSFNVRGEPIVRTPEDAYRCFMRTEMDVLAIENCVLLKQGQPAFEEDRDWREEFELD